MDIDFGLTGEVLDGNEFVVTVHVDVRVVREFRTERDRVVNAFGVGAASDDHRLVDGIAGNVAVRAVKSFD